MEFARVDSGRLAEARDARVIGQHKVQNRRQDFRIVRPGSKIGHGYPGKGEESLKVFLGLSQECQSLKGQSFSLDGMHCKGLYQRSVKSSILILQDKRPLPSLAGALACGQSGHIETLESQAMDAKAKTVLIVEDNELNMKLFHDLLDAHGYNILQTKDGMEALDIAREHHPDLILMDIQLPEVSGLEVTKWLKEDDSLKAIPVVAVTAFAMKGDEEVIRQGGCEAYISKPISVTNFLDTVRRFIG